MLKSKAKISKKETPYCGASFLLIEKMVIPKQKEEATDDIRKKAERREKGQGYID
ncbi:MAG: hypothetical protein ACK451_13560 [Pseudanabaena sp.]